MVHSGSKKGQLETINLKTGKTVNLGKLTAQGFFMQIAPDRHILLFRHTPNSLTLLSLENGNLRQIAVHQLILDKPNRYMPKEYTSTTWYNYFDWAKHMLAWSPDSKMLAYLDYRLNSNAPDLVVISSEGKELQRVQLPELNGPLV